jgi:cytochrome c553
MKKTFLLLALAGLASSAVAVDLAGNTGKVNVSMCIGCHAIAGYKSTFPEVYQVPMLGGQSEKYIENALKAYRKGERRHPTMQGIAASLSDQDIAALAAYYARQK